MYIIIILCILFIIIILLYYRSTSPPGGNQVDGLPPALRTVRIRPMELGGLVHFGEIFELFIELYRIGTHLSYIEYVLRIRLVNISFIFIKYEPSTERSKGLAHARFLFFCFFSTFLFWFVCFNNTKLVFVYLLLVLLLVLLCLPHLHVLLLLLFCTTALRVHPAVTRLTVYRRLCVL